MRMTAAPALPAPTTRVLGSTMPRLWTKPLVTGEPGPCGCGCALTPETSFGFGVIEFAEVILEEPLDPWQQWVVIHACELLPDGRPRFRRVLLLVARQNGKSHLLKTLALYWLFAACVALVVGTSTNLGYAREAWQKSVEDIKGNETLIDWMPPGKQRGPGELPEPGGIREANGQECITTADGCRYKIATSGRKGGRSLTINRLMCDELREHKDWTAYNAAYNAMNAVPDGQAWFTTNAGDDTSIVLIALRKGALGGKDQRLGIFEYSAPEKCDIEDPAAWAAANPNLGRRLDVDSIAGAAALAKENGGEEEAGFKTEVLCMHVPKLNAAVDAGRWNDGKVPGSLADAKRRIALCIDVSPDGQHASLVAAGIVAPGVARVTVVKAWSGFGCTKQLRADLPALLAQHRPRILGWFPGGPAAVLAADFAKRPGWPPRGVTVEEIKADSVAVCMGLADQVETGGVLHSGDPLLDAHVLGAEKLNKGNETWVFGRSGGHCDAAYATAGALHLARTMPPPPSTSVPVSTEVANELARQRAKREQGAASTP